MSNLWLPVGLALASWAGFALGTLPFRVRSSHDAHDLAEQTESSVLNHLYPVTVAFFLGYIAITLIPHALFERGEGIPIFSFAAGVLVMAFLSRKVLRRDPCCETGHKHDPVGWTFFLALAVCAVNDGILIGLIAPPWFSGLNFGMLVHKVTSSFALAMALGHWSYRGNRLLILGIVNGLITPVFFYVGLLLRGQEHVPLESLLGFSAGILVYTVLTGMLPHSREMLRREPIAWFGFLGALVLSVALGLWHSGLH